MLVKCKDNLNILGVSYTQEKQNSNPMFPNAFDIVNHELI